MKTRDGNIWRLLVKIIFLIGLETHTNIRVQTEKLFLNKFSIKIVAVRFILNLMHFNFWPGTFSLNRDVFNLIFFSPFLKFRLKLNVAKIKIVLKTFSVCFFMCIIYKCVRNLYWRKWNKEVAVHVSICKYTPCLLYQRHCYCSAYHTTCIYAPCMYDIILLTFVNLHLTRSCTPTFHILSALVCNSFCGSVREMS